MHTNTPRVEKLGVGILLGEQHGLDDTTSPINPRGDSPTNHPLIIQCDKGGRSRRSANVQITYSSVANDVHCCYQVMVELLLQLSFSWIVLIDDSMSVKFAQESHHRWIG